MIALQVYKDDKEFTVLQVEDMRDFAVSFKALARKEGYKKGIFKLGVFCNIGYKDKKNRIMTAKEYVSKQLKD